MSVKIEVHGIEPNGVDALGGKEGEVLLVSFDDASFTETPLSVKSFMQILRLKLGQKPKAKEPRQSEPKPNGPAVAVPVTPK